MIERERSNETKSGTKGRGKRGLGFWRHSSLCINIAGSHHVPSSLLLSSVPGNIKFIIFSPVHSTLFIIFRARGPRGATRPCRMSQLVMRFSVLSLPPRVTTLMHACVVLYFSRELGSSRNFLSYSCPVRILQSKLCCRQNSNGYAIFVDTTSVICSHVH